MYCENCGERHVDGAAFCLKCGTPALKGNEGAPVVEAVAGSAPAVESAPPPAGGTTINLPPIKIPDSGQFNQFIKFEIMITPIIWKVIYVLGSIAIIIGMFVMMAMLDGAAGFFSALFGGLAMLVWYRIVCELMILLFSIHKELVAIRRK